jgi:hypothetical protein
VADNFSANQVQGIFGEFKPVLDEAVTFSANQVQGIFGEFKPVLDEAAGDVATPADEIMAALRSQGEQKPMRVPDEVVSYG